MKIYYNLQQFPRPQSGCVLTAGNFDGLHNGHRAIIKRAYQIARQKNLPLIAMTFEPTPLQVLAPDIAPKLISPPIMKHQLMSEVDIDTLIILDTTNGLLDIPAENFLTDIMLGHINMKYIVEGSSFNFGHKAKGNIPGLQKWAQDFDFKVELVAGHQQIFDNQPMIVSSTLIRQFIVNYRFDDVRACLNRYYSLAGTIEPMLGRGHSLGFPTANLKLYDKNQLVPGDGVFAGFVQWADSFEQAWNHKNYYPAAISIGPCPTFADGQWQIEAHILGFQGSRDSLTGKHLLLNFVERIRPQQKFDNAEQLIKTIKEDCQKTQNIIANLKYTGKK